MPTERPKKLQRISQACDLCHRRSIRCRPSAENPQQQCQNCYDFAVECTYDRPSRRRRNRSRGRASSPPNVIPSHSSRVPQAQSPTIHRGEGSGHQSRDDAGAAVAGPATTTTAAANTTTASSSLLSAPSAAASSSQHEFQPDEPVDIAWRSFATASAQSIREYLEFFMNVVNPILPLLRAPTLWEDIRRWRHLTDRGFFACVMAACALAAARARDGAAEPTPQARESAAELAEVFSQAAKDTVPKDLGRAMGFDYLRACALLALVSVQAGHVSAMHQYLGQCMTLSAMQGFHDEQTWAASLTAAEREERRCLFWSIYQLDIHTSIAFDGVPKFQEVYSNVSYPSEVEDEALTLGTVQHRDETHLLHGWNVVTDLYRVLEHVMERLQRRERSTNPTHHPAIDALSELDTLPDDQVMNRILALYYDLPKRFRDYSLPPSGDQTNDVFGFQAANIEATFQLTRIALLKLSKDADDHARCEALEQVVSTFRSIAVPYLRAMSVPLVHHLAAIGQMAASMMQEMPFDRSYQRMRMLLPSLADLVEELETGLQNTPGCGQNLREVTEAIDRHLQARQVVLSHDASSQGQLAEQSMHDHPAGHAQNAGIAARQPAQAGEAATLMEDLQLPRGESGEWSWPFDFTQEQDGSILTRYNENDG